ncbi:MAG: PspC domain-containing protein [Treponema sp.]
MKKKLYRSINDKKLFGVCGGLAAYFEVDSSIVRVIWLLALFFGGGGLLCYLIFALVMPEYKEEPIEYEYVHHTDDTDNR